jgi:hypothetical protein
MAPNEGSRVWLHRSLAFSGTSPGSRFPPLIQNESVSSKGLTSSYALTRISRFQRSQPTPCPRWSLLRTLPMRSKTLRIQSLVPTRSQCLSFFILSWIALHEKGCRQHQGGRILKQPRKPRRGCNISPSIYRPRVCASEHLQAWHPHTLSFLSSVRSEISSECYFNPFFYR